MLTLKEKSGHPKYLDKHFPWPIRSELFGNYKCPSPETISINVQNILVSIPPDKEKHKSR
jgi:hypothetical protein